MGSITLNNSERVDITVSDEVQIWSSDPDSSDSAIRDGVTEWWSQPVATYLESPYPRVVHGAISSTGKIMACETNILKGATKRIEAGTIEVDDHNSPSLWAVKDRRFLLGWSGHDSSNSIFFKCSDRKGNISSFANALLYTYASAVSSSYVQIIKINHLSSSNEDVFWVFNRRATTNWQVIPVHVLQDTGEIRFGAAIILFSSTSQSYVTIADAHVASGNQIIRIALGYNPATTIHAIYSFEIDVVTGAITNLMDDTFTANISGTNLPITNPGSLVPFIAEPSSGFSRRLFYVRPGPDAYAVAYADWDKTLVDEATYRVKEFPNDTSGEGLRLTGALTEVGNVTSTYVAAMQTNTFEYEVFFTLAAAPTTSELELGRRANDGTDGNWWFRIRNNRTVVVNLIYVSSSGNPLTGSGTVPVPGKWTDKIGLRLVVGNGLTPKVSVDYSLDDGQNWVNLEQANPAGLANGMKVSNAPVIFGAKNTGNTNSELIIHSAKFKTGTGGTLITGVDFGAEWPDAAINYTDAAGVNLDIVGAAVVDGLKGITVTDLGIAGHRVGYTDSSNYIAGMSFTNPSNDRIVYTAHTDLTTEILKKHSMEYGTEETLVSEPTTSGRLIRPYSPINTGPNDLIYTQMKEYSASTYTDYLGNIKTI